MVAIVAGNGLGLLNTSINTIGARGVLEQSVLGQGSIRAMVNVVNGNLVLQMQDALLAGRGNDLFALRTYNSLGAPTDVDGDGWRWGYEQTVRFQGPGVPLIPGAGATVVRTDGDGHETTFTWDAARAAFIGTEGSGAHDELRYDGPATEWVLTDGSTRVTERYTDSTAPGMTGRLVLRTDTSNNQISLAYDDDRLTMIRDSASQQELRLKYGLFNGLTRLQRLEANQLIDDANGHATTTLGDPLRLVEYDYDLLGRLTTVTRLLNPTSNGTPIGAGFITNYGYDGSSTRIASVMQSDGTSTSFTYDAAGRLSAVKDDGGAPGTQLAFAYDLQPNSTAITDGDGQIWTYRHDGMTGQLLEVLTPPAGGTAISTKFAYDNSGNLTGITDPQNNAFFYGYDESGNRALERDALGNTTTRTFSTLNQVLTETRYRIPDPDGAGLQDPGDPFTTRYVHDANARLRFVVSAEGRVTENRYGSTNAGFGLLTQSLLYVGRLFDVTGLSPTQQLTEAEMIDWVAELPDQTQVQLTEYSYDLRGNISQQTSYATISASGAGVLDDQASIEEFVYDAQSQLRQRITVRGSARDHRTVVSSFGYDGMTRVLESNGANGHQTTVYDDVNNRVIVTAASGLIETRDFDGRGRLKSVSQTGDGTTRQTRYFYDNADRLRMVEDAQGGRRYRFYDAAGRLEYQVDATGAVTKFEHNAAGLLVHQTQYLHSAETSSWFDSATQTVSKTDLTVGGAGSDVNIDAAHDRTSAFNYDKSGRLIATTDAVNTVTTISYDGLSRVIMTQTGDRVTRYLYDRDNRRVGIVDALGFFTEYKYDAGGRLIETVRYSQPSPASAPSDPHSDQPSAWRPADNGALRSFLYYDGQGRVVGAVDEQQFLTETIYDDALNTVRTLRYLSPVTVVPGDQLASLKSRAGASRQLSFTQYDDFGRVREVTALDGSTITRNEYDEAGRLTRVVSAANTNEERIRCTFYNAFGEITATLGGEGSAFLGTNPSPQLIDETIRDFGIRYKYDTLGRMVLSIDANGHQSLCYYDRENRRTHQVNVIGQSADHSLAGEVSETIYNSFGQAVLVRRYAARIAAGEMDQLLAEGGGLADQSLLSKLSVLADASVDQVIFYEYDRCGRQVKQIDGENGFIGRIYNAHGELAAQVRSTRNGQTTTMQLSYDLKGRVVAQTDDVGGINAITLTEYDAFGRVIRSVDGTGRAIATAYPDSGRSIEVTDELQRTTRTEYDALGRISRQTNALGQQTDYIYDETARSVTSTTPEGRQVLTARTRHGETLSVTDGRGNVTRFGFNRDGQQTTVTDALGRVIALTTYDKSGRRSETTDARGTVMRFGYDQRDRIVERRIDPTGLNITTLTDFDALGRPVRVTEGAGTTAECVTTYGYDRKGRTKTVVQDGAAGGLQLCTSYSYDDLDNVVTVAHGTVTNPNLHVMLYGFDNLGRRINEIAAPSSLFGPGAPGTRDLTTAYRYDASGRLTRRIDPLGQSTWQVYDAAGQLTHIINALGDVSENRYDAAGRLIYNQRYINRLAPGTVAAFADVVSSFAHPAMTPKDRRSHFVFDGDGRARFSLSFTGANGWIISENRYDANGNVIEVRAYDRFLPDARVMALDTAASPGITVAEIENELNTLGYLDDDPATLASVPRTFFAYDAINRQRYTVGPTGSIAESVYDEAGNLSVIVNYAALSTLVDHREATIDAAVDRDDPENRVTRYVHDAVNRLRYTIDALGSVDENEFDARGNVVTAVRWATRPSLTQFTESAIAAALAAMPAATDQVTRFVYDAGNRLRYTIDATGSVSENTYDAVGNLTRTTRFVRRPMPPPAAFHETAVAAAIEPLRNDIENQVTRFAYDAEKRLRFMVDSLGSVTESVYDANGNLLTTRRFRTRPTFAQADESTIAAAVGILQLDSRNRVTRFAYDALNRLRFTVDALGSISERVHDALGNLTVTERFAVRPGLILFSEAAIESAIAPHHNHSGNRIEHHLYDAIGRIRFSLLRLTQEAGQFRYQVSAQELNALGQTIGSTTYATAVALADINEEAIIAAVGDGDPSRDRVRHFVYDLDGRPIYQLQAVTVEADRRTYRVNAQQFDAFGQVAVSTDHARTVAPDTFDQTAVEAAVMAVADPARDRVAAVAYDVLGQPIYRVQSLGSDSYQVGKQEYNALGRVFRTTQYHNAVTPLTGFDRTTIEAAANAVASANDRKVQFVHDANGRPRFVLQADKTGHWTVGESRYDAPGNLVESRRYDRLITEASIESVDAMRPSGAGEADLIDLLAALGYSDSAPASLAEIQRSRFAYDTLNRLRFSIDSLGSVVEDVYNALGDRKTNVRFAARPAPEQYTEPEIDALVNRNDAGNRVEHFAYDALGQLRFNVQVIEPNVGTSGKHSINERRYDALGQLIESRSFCTFVGHLIDYDETTVAAAIVPDATNDRRSVVAYDAGGRQVFALRELRVGQADGYVVTRQVHDALGQLINRVDYASPAAPTQFDAAGVESAVVVQSFADRTTTYVRDAAGRLRFEIRPDLSFCESVYDTFDQVTQSRHFDFRLPSQAALTEAEMIALRGDRAVGDGVTRGQTHTYDAAGRLTSTVDALGNTEQYEYNALGNRSRWTDKNGHVFSCEFDRRGRKIGETTPLLKFKLRGEDPATPAPDRVIETRIEYDAFGNLIRKIEAANFTSDASITDYSFDTAGRPTSILYPGFYDPVTGTVETDPGANRFRPEASIIYDTLGNAVRTGYRTGVNSFDHTSRTYDSQGQIAHEINALNNVTSFKYNSFGEREVVTRYGVTLSGTPQNGVYWTPAEIDPQLNRGHDENGNLIEDFEARAIRISYDQLGRKSTVTLPTSTFYSTHTPGVASQANYFRLSPASVFGNLDAGVTRYEYNLFGDLTRQRVRINTIVEWQDTSFTYDVLGRRIRSVDAAGNITVASYDVAGNLVFHDEMTGFSDGSDRITEFAYNLLDQQIRVDRYGLRFADADGVEHGVAHWTWEDGGFWVDPDANVVTTVRTTNYDSYGRPLVVTDAAGNLTSMRYNALGQLVEVIAPVRLVAPIAANGENGVDPFRNQISEKLVTTITMDPFGRAVRLLRSTSDGRDARELRQSYDLAGNLVTTTDAEGNVKRRACDPAGRVIRESQSIQVDLGPLGINGQGLERRYAYDALGQLTDTLDVYFDGDDEVQSGKSVVYNAFGEVVEERRKWGPADQSPATLNTAKVAWFHYDNAGHVFEKVAADGLTLYFYNLLGQVTREEKRGNSNPTDGTDRRITEIQYDVLGRATMIRRPAFNADVTPATGTTLKLVTPYSTRRLDRWGNVTNTEEGGYDVFNGPTTFAPNRIFRTYGYDDNNMLVTEILGTHGFMTTNGVSTSGLIIKRTLRDLLGNVVMEIDEARDTQSDELISSRTRRKQYDNIGQLTAEIDGTNRKIEYAYNIHGERMGTRNARGTVYFDRRDRNGNIRFHGILRTSRPPGEYNSFNGTGVVSRTYLNAYQYDQANRRFASKTFMEGTNAPWSFTWLDGRNFGIRQRDTMGVVTQYRFDQFGNKAVEIDGAGARSEWDASTEEFAVGRIEKYRLPADNGLKFGSYGYNDFGEIKFNGLSNTRTEYDRHLNGLVSDVTIIPDVTNANVREITTYQYDARGQMTSESRIDSISIQVRLISYDNQGRLARVEDQNKAPAGPISDVRYDYDEWGNVRRIQANYTQTPAEGPRASASWFAYDNAGRMTVSNGIPSGGTIIPKVRTSGSAKINYDNVGRRSGTTEFVRRNNSSLPTMLRTFDTMRDERYEYDDLGHIRLIEQRVRQVNIVETSSDADGDPVTKPDRNGPWQPLSTRTANLRGDVTRSEQWSRISGLPNNLRVDMVPARIGTTTTTYRADGQMLLTKTDAVDPKKSTETQNNYNSLNGQLESYLFKAFRSDGASFNTTFEYLHTFQNGQRVVRRIRDVANGLNTTKTYDPLGRLSSERVDLQKPNGGGSDRVEERIYKYNSDGRAIYKHTNLRLTSNGPNTVPLPTPTTGEQTYVYAGERMAATVGALRLANATKFDFAYTPMSEATGSGASRYVVQNGDSLIDIAQAIYGDGGMWYIIADANGSVGEPGDPLPSTEVGKAYEIPDVVRSSQTASTFKPYALAEIIGNDRPIAIPPPPPPKYSDLELMAASAISITVQIGVTIGLSALGVPAPVSYALGAGLSNLAGQATSWSLGMPGQNGIDWGNVGMAAMEGFMFSMAGPAATLSREIWQQGKSGFSGWTSGPGLNWTGIAGSLFNVGFDALAPALGGPRVGQFNFGLGALINSAYNPSSGWAVSSNGRSPVVGAFEYAYSAVANGLANMGYNWIRQQIERPSAPAPAPGPRSVDDPRGPLPADLLDMWDELDMQQVEKEDREANAARNKQISEASDESLRWRTAFDRMQDLIDHFGENIDDRAIIKAARRQLNAERVQQEKLTALARARAAAKAAERRANTAQIEALRMTPDPNLLQYVREMDELNDQILKGFYSDGTYTRVTEGTNIDGLKFENRSGLYDSTGAYTFRNAELDEVVEMFRKLSSNQPWKQPVFIGNEMIMVEGQAPNDPLLVGNEVIIIHDLVTPAEQSRRLGFDNVMNFDEYKRVYKFRNGTTKGVEREFLDYHDNLSRRIVSDWRRIDNANGAAKFILTTLATAPLAGFDPILIFGPMVVGAGAERVAKWAGYDELFASGVGMLASIGSSFVMPSVGSLGIGSSSSKIESYLAAERTARFEQNAAKLEAQGLEWELSHGIQVGEGATLFKSMPAQARAARPAASAPALLDAPSSPSSLGITGDVPISGGVPAIAGQHYYSPGAVNPMVTYESTAARGMSDAMQIGGIEPRSRVVANITDGSGGFTGGNVVSSGTVEMSGLPRTSVAPLPISVPPVGQLMLPAGRTRGNLNLTPSLGPIPMGPGNLGYRQFGSKIFASRVRSYVEAVNSNRPWSWDEIGLGHLDDAEREVVKMRAVQAGFIPDIPINAYPAYADIGFNIPGTANRSYADFSSVLIEERMLPENLWLATDDVQFGYLDNLIGGRPAGTTWHHHEIPGLMQLVPFGIHKITGHRGGRSIGEWADAPR
jgi:YD repeat-containing protein